MEEVFEVDSGSYNKHGFGRRRRVVRKGRRSRKRMDEDSGRGQAVLAKLSNKDGQLLGASVYTQQTSTGESSQGRT